MSWFLGIRFHCRLGFFLWGYLAISSNSAEKTLWDLFWWITWILFSVIAGYHLARLATLLYRLYQQYEPARTMVKALRMFFCCVTYCNPNINNISNDFVTALGSREMLHNIQQDLLVVIKTICCCSCCSCFSCNGTRTQDEDHEELQLLEEDHDDDGLENPILSSLLEKADQFPTNVQAARSCKECPSILIV